MSERQVTPRQALLRLATLCAKAEQCEHDLRSKLHAWRIDPDMADRIIARLEHDHYLDNGRYARAYVHDKLHFQRWGRQKILAGLYARHLPSAMCREAMEELDAEVYRANCAELLRPMRGDGPLGPEARLRIIRRMMARGYEPALVREILDEPDDDNADEP